MFFEDLSPEHQFIRAARIETAEAFKHRLGTVDINVRTASGTALHQAYSTGNHEVASLLLGHGTNPYAVNDFGLSVLHAAVATNNASAVRTLLERRAIQGVDPRINDADPFGRTPLHIAAGMGNYDMCKTLLGFGASPKSLDASGYPPIYHAAANGKWQVHGLLLAVYPDGSKIAPAGAKNAADLAPDRSAAKRTTGDSTPDRRMPPSLRMQGRQ